MMVVIPLNIAGVVVTDIVERFLKILIAAQRIALKTKKILTMIFFILILDDPKYS